jgi:hypothetical protein
MSSRPIRHHFAGSQTDRSATTLPVNLRHHIGSFGAEPGSGHKNRSRLHIQRSSSEIVEDARSIAETLRILCEF